MAKINKDKEVQELKQKIEELERLVKNHMKHSPLISQMLAFIRQTRLLTLDDLRRKFPMCYGSNQMRLFSAMKEKPEEYLIISGGGRGVKTIIAYLPYKEPKTMEEIALDYFLRISQRKKKVASIDEIKKIYNLKNEEAEAVWSLFTHVFQTRLKMRPDGKAAMLKTYYKEYVKQLKALGRRF